MANNSNNKSNNNASNNTNNNASNNTNNNASNKKSYNMEVGGDLTSRNNNKNNSK